MSRKAVIIVLMCMLVATEFVHAGMFRKTRSGDRGGIFPENEAVEDLMLTSKTRTYSREAFQELYGAAGNRYIQFGLINMMSADYEYGGKDRRISLEVATMESPTAAAGLFHHHRGKVLNGRGEPVPGIGAESILDVKRGGRNLYFYRSKMFVKIVYSGKEPVPSLTPIAEYVDAHLPAGRDERPEGFKYIEVEGINKNTIALTPGFTFNLSFLPAAVWASAPGGGSLASDLFIITKYHNNDATDLFRDYTAYLRLHAEYIDEYTHNSLKLTKAVDPNQGRVVFAAYKNVLIIAARPDGYEKGEALIEQVIAKIDGSPELEPDTAATDPFDTPDDVFSDTTASDTVVVPDDGDDGDDDDDGNTPGQKPGRKWNPFRRRGN